MEPEEIKAKVQGAYVRAINNRNMWRQRGSRIQDLFRGVHLYGRDAAVDFVDTHLHRIVQEAVDMAECKDTLLSITTEGFGRAALDAMAEALRERTSLKVEVAGATLRLIWAEATPGLV